MDKGTNVNPGAWSAEEVVVAQFIIARPSLDALHSLLTHCDGLIKSSRTRIPSGLRRGLISIVAGALLGRQGHCELRRWARTLGDLGIASSRRRHGRSARCRRQYRLSRKNDCWRDLVRGSIGLRYDRLLNWGLVGKLCCAENLVERDHVHLKRL